MKPIQPEIRYPFIPLCIDEIKRAYEQNESVTGFVEKICIDSKECIVHLGNKIFATLPFSEVTVYPLKEGSNNTPIQVHSIKERKIRVKILSMSEDKIILSRRRNMIESAKKLCKGLFVTGYVRCTTHEVIYLDLGDGLTGILRKRNINTESTINRDDLIDVKIINVSDNYRYILAYDNIDLKQFVGKVLDGTVKGKIHDKYFIEFPNHVNGILSVYPGTAPLENGARVKCYVRCSTEKGLRLYLDRNQ